MGHVQYTLETGADNFASLMQDTPGKTQINTLKKQTLIASAIVSVSLALGVGAWGYQLVMRDVNGIPVVRAMQNEMRVRHENPGGLLAEHTGLSVNAVAALGVAAAPADELILAPEPIDLHASDYLDTARSAPDDANLHHISTPAGARQHDSILAPQPIRVQSLTQTAAVASTVQIQPTSDTSTHKYSALRPVPRLLSKGSAPAPSEPGSDTRALESVPPGTRVVQLGTYPSAQVARAKWADFEARFGDYFVDKSRLIQPAQSGGRIFFRLRAHGFSDLPQARAFCAEMSAQGQDCLPILTR